jgi:hypothetical protein
MQDTSEQIPAGTKLVFLRCDICEREYGEEEMKLKNAMGEYSEEDLEGNEPLLLLCDLCHQGLEILSKFHTIRVC